ncbi:MAG: antibiotic biosynthesis monooxygenase [Saprospiraceae bacterium]|nr:antibiotic biosynthesis monooxygenase [Saprospiraceae bacterium]
MIKRIVKLTFRAEECERFLEIFEESSPFIRNFEGCTHLELWRGKLERHVFFTYSIWRDEEALDAYRHSDLFKTTWAKTKVLFADAPHAWSVEEVNSEQ